MYSNLHIVHNNVYCVIIFYTTELFSRIIAFTTLFFDSRVNIFKPLINLFTWTSID